MIRQEPYNTVLASVTEVGFMHSFMHSKQNFATKDFHIQKMLDKYN